MTQNFDEIQNFRRERALQACAQFQNPSHSLNVIGVTGTNGKTTSTYLVENLLKTTGRRVGVIGTVENRFEDYRVNSINTTPGSIDLQKFLSDFLKRGATDVVMEVTSHGLHQYRTWGTRFKAVLFTNLTQDHLDYHHTMEEYFRVKGMLFLDYQSDLRIINVDDPWGQKLAQLCRERGHKVITYGASYASVNHNRVKATEHGIQGSFESDYEGRKTQISVNSPLMGVFNIQNLCQTAALGIGLGLDEATISQGLNTCTGVPGRMQAVVNPKGYRILVDYAHTPDALEKALLVLKPLCRGRLCVVFGCGGDRDPGKRPVMGAIAERIADQVYVTSDNPRTEDPQQIVDQILTGIHDHNRCHVIVDRKRAIEQALSDLRGNDILLIAGKGHEDYQILGDQKIHFDDREVVWNYYRES